MKVVIAESFERIHRSNLIGMGVLPLQFPEGENADSLGLTGQEVFDIEGVTALNDGAIPSTVRVTATSEGGVVEFDAPVRIDTPGEADYFRNGGSCSACCGPCWIREARCACRMACGPAPVGAGFDEQVVGWLLDRLPPEYRTSPLQANR